MRREEFEKEYRKNIEEIPIPDILKKDYKCESCLKERRDTKTLLVYKKDNKRPYILKIAEHKPQQSWRIPKRRKKSAW